MKFLGKHFGAIYLTLLVTMIGSAGYVSYQDHLKSKSMEFACTTLKGFYIYANGHHYCFTSDNLFREQ